MDIYQNVESLLNAAYKAYLNGQNFWKEDVFEVSRKYQIPENVALRTYDVAKAEGLLSDKGITLKGADFLVLRDPSYTIAVNAVNERIVLNDDLIF